MNARLVLAALTLTACDGVDLHYVGDAASDGGDASLLIDAGAVDPTGNDADPGGGPNGLCGCDFRGGESCCIFGGSKPAFCTENGTGCALLGGVAIGCTASDPDSESLCCWSGPAAPGNHTGFASTCTHGPLSCATSADCNGGTCMLQKCGTVTITACDITPTCP